MGRANLIGMLVGVSLLAGACERVLADGFIVIEKPIPWPIVPPQPPRPPRPAVRNVPLAVRNHQVSCRITDGVASTSIDQVFYNPNPRQVEGTYIFPLADDIALSGFSMFVNGVEIKGEVLDRAEARRVYESIVAKMRDPALLEYAGTRMYRARIFPIPASGEVRVKLNYSQILKTDGGLVRYRYPLSTEKFSSRLLEQVSVVIQVDSSTPIKSVFCPTHNMSVIRHSDTQASASFEARQVKPDKDLVLYYTLSDEAFGLALLTYRQPGRDGFFLARVAPKARLDVSDVQPKDICFVLDTSGSMAGEKLAQAKRALKYCLNNLNAGDRFQLVAFSHESRLFAEGLTEAKPETVRSAVAFVENLRAEGGTNIHDALLDGLKGSRSAGGGRPYQIVFLTDGQPTIGQTDPAKILAEVAEKNGGAVRLFVFGIGDDVNTQLLDKLAEQNKGARDYVGDKEDLEIKVSSFYRKVANPVLSDLKLTFPSMGAYDMYPQRLPDLFAGSEVVVVGRYSGGGSGAVELTGHRRGSFERYVYEKPFATSDTNHEFLPRLWAMRKVGFLLDEIRLHGENPELVSAVSKLAIEYGIVTPYTAFLVHEQQKRFTDNRAGAQIMNRLLERAETNAKGRGGTDGISLGRKKFKMMRSRVGGSFNVADSVQAFALQGAAAPQAAVAKEVLADLEGHDEAGRRLHPIRRVAGRTLYYDGSAWNDADYVPGTKTVKIANFSREQLDLANRDRRAAKLMAQGLRVVFLLDGVAYETVPGI
ncbi:MAG: VIT domain-containing protein [Phycisphaerae bacterium]